MATATQREKRNAQIVELLKGGSTVAEIAAGLSIGQPVVYAVLRKAGVSVRKDRPRKVSERDQKMCSMYQQGLTLEKIGAQFKITRERVRQILRNLGIDACDGGQQVVAAAKRARKTSGKEAAAQAKYGVSYELLRVLRTAGVTHAFAQQKKNAASRGIDWNLTLGEWHDIWEKSGKLALRGRGVGKYVMSRIRDTGHYELGNVHIQLSTDNNREAVEKWRGKTKEHRGVFNLLPGLPKPWMAQVQGKCIGYFASEAEAVAARSSTLSERGIRDVSGLGQGLGYTRTKRGYYYMQAPNRRSTHKTPEEARAAYLSAIADLRAERAQA